MHGYEKDEDFYQNCEIPTMGRRNMVGPQIVDVMTPVGFRERQ